MLSNFLVLTPVAESSVLGIDKQNAKVSSVYRGSLQNAPLLSVHGIADPDDCLAGSTNLLYEFGQMRLNILCTETRYERQFSNLFSRIQFC